MYQDVLQTILDTKIIAILRGVAPDQLTPLAEVLYQGGIRCIEVTFDQKRADGVPTLSRVSPEPCGGACTSVPEPC